MASVKRVFAAVQTITITLTSLADSSSAGRECTVIDNSANLYLDAFVAGKIKTQNSGSISSPSCVYVWAYGTVDGGTTYPDTVTGSDAAITMNGPPNNLRLLGVINVAAINTTYSGGPWSMANVFGALPEKWGIVIQNDCGTAFSSTAGDHVWKYEGVYQSVT